jgi:putative redox protein
MRAEGHTWVGDEPKWLGGDGAGPSPFAQLAGALAACTISTLCARARIEDIPLTACSVEVTPLVKLDGVGMLDEPADSPLLYEEDNIKVRIGRLVREIRLEGELTSQHVARLELIAALCPISQSIERAIPIRTRVTLSE